MKPALHGRSPCSHQALWWLGIKAQHQSWRALGVSCYCMVWAVCLSTVSWDTSVGKRSWEAARGSLVLGYNWLVPQMSMPAESGYLKAIIGLTQSHSQEMEYKLSHFRDVKQAVWDWWLQQRQHPLSNQSLAPSTSFIPGSVQGPTSLKGQGFKFPSNTKQVTGI